MVEHGAMTSAHHEPQADADPGSAPLGPTRISWIFASRRAQALVGIAALALIALALGLPASMLLFFGVILLCPLMMLGMHGGHQGHGRHEHAMAAGASDTESDRALDILRERYARGELTREQYDAMRRDLV